MMLPAELRNMVYNHLRSKVVDTWQSREVVNPLRRSRRGSPWRDFLALTLTSKRMSAIPIYYPVLTCLRSSRVPSLTTSSDITRNT